MKCDKSSKTKEEEETELKMIENMRKVGLGIVAVEACLGAMQHLNPHLEKHPKVAKFYLSNREHPPYKREEAPMSLNLQSNQPLKSAPDFSAKMVYDVRIVYTLTRSIFIPGFFCFFVCFFFGFSTSSTGISLVPLITTYSLRK